VGSFFFPPTVSPPPLFLEHSLIKHFVSCFFSGSEVLPGLALPSHHEFPVSSFKWDYFFLRRTPFFSWFSPESLILRRLARPSRKKDLFLSVFSWFTYFCLYHYPPTLSRLFSFLHPPFLLFPSVRSALQQLPCSGPSVFLFF